MRVGELRGWSQAVERARSLWPEIPMWAFDWAAQEKAAVRTYEEAEWFSVHPIVAAEHAVRAAAARGHPLKWHQR